MLLQHLTSFPLKYSIFHFSCRFLFACRHSFCTFHSQILIFIFDQNELREGKKNVEKREQASTLTQTDYKILFGAHFRHSTATFHIESSRSFFFFILHLPKLQNDLHAIQTKNALQFSCCHQKRCSRNGEYFRLLLLFRPSKSVDVVVVAKTWSFIGFLFIDYTIIIARKIFHE